MGLSFNDLAKTLFKTEEEFEKMIKDYACCYNYDLVEYLNRIQEVRDKIEKVKAFEIK